MLTLQLDDAVGAGQPKEIAMTKRLMKFGVVLVGILVLAVELGPSSAAAAPKHHSKQIAQLTKQLERLAAELSSLLADNEFRATVSAQFKASAKTNTVVLRDVLVAAARQGQKNDAERLFELASSVQRMEMIMKDSGAPIPRLDLTLAVNTYHDLLQSSDTVYVAVAALADESQVKSIKVYSNGKGFTLGVNEPPKIPTIVVAPAETESLDPDYPLTILKEPGDEANKNRIVDDFVGVPYILITDDHDPGTSPEIYIKIRRWLLWPGTFVDNKIELAGVNKENKWYWLGDHNDTYKFVDAGFHGTIEIAVWERDGWFNPDDFLGVFFVNRTSLPFGGYTGPLSNGDARIYVDRD